MLSFLFSISISIWISLCLSSGAPPVGMNLGGVSYFSQGLPWKNRLNGAMPFKSEGIPNGTLNIDSNGYVQSLFPGQTASSLFLDLPSKIT